MSTLAALLLARPAQHKGHPHHPYHVATRVHGSEPSCRWAEPRNRATHAFCYVVRRLPTLSWTSARARERTGGGLVQEEQPRSSEQLGGNGNAAALPARESPHPGVANEAVRHFLEPQLLDHLQAEGDSADSVENGRQQMRQP